MVDYKFIKLTKSTNPEKKYMVIFQNKKTGRKKTIHFGAFGMEDYTTHKQKNRQLRYIARHSKMNEDWTDSGIMSSGWWSRWLLWSEPNMKDAKKLVYNKLKNAGYI